MSSVPRAASYTKQGNDFFINVATINANTTVGAGQGNLYTLNETAGTIAIGDYSGSTLLNATSFTTGTLLLKDLGKTVTVAGARYRKVQPFNVPAGISDTSLAGITFYILLNPISSNACYWARMTLQA